MSSPWSNTVDRALRTTNETLERLQRAEVTYEQARTRLFPGERSPLHERSRITGGSRLDVPPPLPRSRYQSAATDTTVPQRNVFADENPALADVLHSQSLVRSQIQTLVAELALERAARTDSINDLRALHQHQVATLTSSVTQLKEENEYLKQSVRALETRQAYQRGLRTGPVSDSGIGVYAPLNGTSGLVDTSHVTTGAGADALTDAKVNFLNTAASLADVKRRLSDVEATVRAQAERLHNRHDRADSVVSDLVKTQVAVEVERVRSIAREAARDATEELVKLRLNAIQSMFNAELQKVLESTGISQALTATTEQQLRRLQREWESRLLVLEGECQSVVSHRAELEKTRVESTSAVAAVQDAVRGLRNDVSSVKQQAQEDALRHTQLLHNKVDGARAEVMLAVTQLLDDRERLRQNGATATVSEAEVRRLLEMSLAPLHTALEQTQAAHQREWERTDGAVQMVTRRLTAVESAQRTQADIISRVEEESARADATQTALRDAVNAIQQNQRTTQLSLQELTTTVKATSSSVEELEAQHQSAEQSQAEALRAVQKEHLSRLTEWQRQQTESTQSTAAQLDNVTNTIATLQQEQRRLTVALNARMEALKGQFEENCVHPLDALQSTVEALTSQQKQLRDSKAYQEKITAQQLADLNTELGRRTADAEANARRYADQLNEGRKQAGEILSQRVTGVENANHSLAAAIAAHTAPAKERAVAGPEPATPNKEVAWRQLEQRVATLEQRPAATPSQPAPSTVAASAAEPPVSAPLASAESVQTLRSDIGAVATRADKLEADHASVVDGLRTIKEQLADTQRGLAEAETRLNAGLQRVEQALQTQRTELRGQADQRDAFANKQMAALSDHAEKLVADVRDNAKDSMARIRESLTPARMAANLSTDGAAVEQLASLVEPHLRTVHDLTDRVKALQQQLEDERRVAMTRAGENDRSVDEIKEREARAKTDASTAAQLQDLLARVIAVEADVFGRDQAVRAHIRDWQRDHVAARTALEEAAQRANDKIEAHEQALANVTRDQSALSASQQEMLTRAHEQLRSLEEALRGAQDASVQPLRIKLRAIEENVSGLQEAYESLRTRVSDATTTCVHHHEQDCQQLSQLAATTSADRDELCTKLLATIQERYALVEARIHCVENQLRDELDKWQKTTDARLEPLATRLEAIGAAAAMTGPDVSVAARRDANLAEILDPIDEQLQQLQAQLDDVLARGAAPDSAVPPTAAYLAHRLAAVEQRLAELKDSEDAGLLVTADALGSLSDSLQHCVERVREELQRSHLWSGNLSPRSGGVSENDDTSTPGSSPRSSIEAIDDIFVFLLRQLRQVFHALGALQESTIYSLDMIQQQELDRLSVTPLQRAVLDLVHRLEPVARAVGVDPATLQVDVGPVARELIDDVDASALSRDHDEISSAAEL